MEGQAWVGQRVVGQRLLHHRPSARPSIVVGLSRHLPFDRRPRRSHPGGRGPAAVRGPASAPGSSIARGQVGCRAAEGDGVRGRADVAGGAGAGQLGLDPPGSTATEMTSGNLRFQARPGQRRTPCSRRTPAGIGLPAKGRGLRACGPRQARASQSNRPCSSADSRRVSRCGARTFTAKVVS
jgi:hypothetical protein